MPRKARRSPATPVPLAPAPRRSYPKGTPVPMPKKEGNYGKARNLQAGPKKAPARRKMI
jgi:hypothetical protein